MAKYHVIVYRVPVAHEEIFPGEALRQIPIVAVDAAWATYFAMKMVTDGGGLMPAGAKQADTAGLNIFVRAVL
jgi:hypothetical protein